MQLESTTIRFTNIIHSYVLGNTRVYADTRKHYKQSTDLSKADGPDMLGLRMVRCRRAVLGATLGAAETVH